MAEKTIQLDNLCIGRFVCKAGEFTHVIHIFRVHIPCSYIAFLELKRPREQSCADLEVLAQE